MSRPTLSVVIPTHNGRTLLEPCLSSLRRHRPPGPPDDLEVIVVDDASTDGIAAWIAGAFPEVRLVRLDPNGGFCAAANAGIAAARGRFIQLLNNDAEVCPGWFDAGLAPFADPTRRLGRPARPRPLRPLPRRLRRRLLLLLRPPDQARPPPGRPRSGHDHPSDEVFGASASSAFYRASALRRTGGFDPSYGSYYEDVDLAFRLRWAGYRCVYAPDCRVLHDVSATYDHGSPALHRRMSRNAEALFWSNLPTPWLVASLLPRLVFLLAQLCWKLQPRPCRRLPAGQARRAPSCCRPTSDPGPIAAPWPARSPLRNRRDREGAGSGLPSDPFPDSCHRPAPSERSLLKGGSSSSPAPGPWGMPGPPSRPAQFLGNPIPSDRANGHHKTRRLPQRIPDETGRGWTEGVPYGS